jgi:hypothetical protein
MEAADIVARMLEAALASAKSRGIPVTGTAEGNQMTLLGATTITDVGNNTFNVRASWMTPQGFPPNHAPNQPARFGASDPPSSPQEAQSKIDRWLADELKLSRLPAA